MKADVPVTEIEKSVVYVIDDDASVRASLADLMESLGLQCALFDSVQAFLDQPRADVPSCLVLDIRMPGMTGMEFHRQMVDLGVRMPVIFITAHGDISMSVQAMKAGAIDFLPKPFRDQDLIEAIHRGLEQDRQQREQVRALEELQRAYALLNEGEKAVLERVARGLLNKQIAAELHVSEITVKVRRSSIRKKLGMNSVAEMTRLVDRLREAENES